MVVLVLKIADIAFKSLRNATEPKTNAKGAWVVVGDQAWKDHGGAEKVALADFVGLREVGRAERKLKICLVSVI